MAQGGGHRFFFLSYFFYHIFQIPKNFIICFLSYFSPPIFFIIFKFYHILKFLKILIIFFYHISIIKSYFHLKLESSDRKQTILLQSQSNFDFFLTVFTKNVNCNSNTHKRKNITTKSWPKVIYESYYSINVKLAKI